MLTKSPSQTTHRFLAIMLSLIILCTAISASPASASDQRAALVRVELTSIDQLNTLAEQGLQVFAEIYTEDGRVVLLLPAEPAMQASLAQQGYPVQVLDFNARQAEFLLIEGTGEELQQVSSITPLLMVEGQQAIIRTTPAQAENLSAQGLLWRPLRLHRLLPQEVSAKTPNQPESLPASPLVQEMLSQVSQAQLYNYVGGLSGEWPISIEGSNYTLYTRYTWASTPITKATRYTHDFFQSLGLMTDYDYYSISGYERRNVMVQQTGISQPNRIFLLTAHLDSYSNAPYSSAPGADDNASGSAAVMHIANILRNYQFDCTIRYVLFTGEEQGMYGSYAYAEDMYNQGQNIAGVLNLDMIAFNTIGSYPSIELHTRPGNASDLVIANLFKDAVTTYQIGLYPIILQDGKSFSDHSSFWNFGYPAILAIEDWNDHTPDYHQTTDRLSTLDMPYYKEFTRAALATFAHMGCLRQGTLSGHVTDAKTGQPLPGATIQARLDASNSWQTTALSDGTYQLILIPGSYQLEASAPAHLPASYSNIPINVNQTTTQNFALQPCSTFQNLNFTFSPSEPAVGQTVTFNASVTGSSPVYSWSFGDGGNASGPNVNHAFASSGGFQVRLTISNACTPTSIVKTVLVGLIFHVYLPNAPLVSTP
jgi:hypothetical protein